MRMQLPSALWMLCAFAMASILSLPQYSGDAQAQAKPRKSPKKRAIKKKSIRQCMDFSQKMAPDEEGVDLVLRSSCTAEVVCSLEWNITCVDSDGATSSTPSKRSSTLAYTDSIEANASAAQCEEDWQLDSVKWHCDPVAP